MNIISVYREMNDLLDISRFGFVLYFPRVNQMAEMIVSNMTWEFSWE